MMKDILNYCKNAKEGLTNLYIMHKIRETGISNIEKFYNMNFANRNIMKGI